MFVDTHGIVGERFELSNEVDRSGVGASLTILTAAQSIDEATNYWPGIGVTADGFVPFASCEMGSGDYYYINSHDGPNGPLYRIYHDSVGEGGYERSEAVAVVLATPRN